MAAIHLSSSRPPGGRTHVMPKRLALACATAAVAELGYLVGRIVNDVQRIEADRRQ